jgi:hypothetical protein
MYVRAALPGAAPVTNIIRPQDKLFSIQKVAQNDSASRFMSSILSAALRCWNADRDRYPEGVKVTRQSGFRATHSAVTLTNTKYREIVVTYTIETFVTWKTIYTVPIFQVVGRFSRRRTYNKSRWYLTESYHRGVYAAFIFVINVQGLVVG